MPICLHLPKMLFHRHFLLKAEEADLAQIVLVPRLNRCLNATCARTNQYVLHQLVEPATFEVHFVQVDSLLFEDDLLSGAFSQLPLVLHQLDVLVHFLFSLDSLLNLFNLIVQRLVKVSNVLLSIVYVLLVV